MELEFCPGTGKIAYRSKREAWAAAKGKRKRGAGVSQVYTCPHCHLLHVSTPARGSMRKLKWRRRT